MKDKKRKLGGTSKSIHIRKWTFGKLYCKSYIFTTRQVKLVKTNLVGLKENFEKVLKRFKGFTG